MNLTFVANILGLAESQKECWWSTGVYGNSLSYFIWWLFSIKERCQFLFTGNTGKWLGSIGNIQIASDYNSPMIFDNPEE